MILWKILHCFLLKQNCFIDCFVNNKCVLSTFEIPQPFLAPNDFFLSDINTIKNQINSLLFVKKVCDSRIQRLQSGKVSIKFEIMPSCKYLTAIKISVCAKKSQQDLKHVGVYVHMLKDMCRLEMPSMITFYIIVRSGFSLNLELTCHWTLRITLYVCSHSSVWVADTSLCPAFLCESWGSELRSWSLPGKHFANWAYS